MRDTDAKRKTTQTKGREKESYVSLELKLKPQKVKCFGGRRCVAQSRQVVVTRDESGRDDSVHKS